MIRRPPRSTQGVSSAASDVYKRQVLWAPADASARARVEPDASEQHSRDTLEGGYTFFIRVSWVIVHYGRRNRRRLAPGWFHCDSAVFSSIRQYTAIFPSIANYKPIMGQASCEYIGIYCCILQYIAEGLRCLAAPRYTPIYPSIRLEDVPPISPYIAQ